MGLEIEYDRLTISAFKHWLSQTTMSPLGRQLFICSFDLRCTLVDKKAKMVNMGLKGNQITLPHQKVRVAPVRLLSENDKRHFELVLELL